jgi:hypothetical protein
VHQCLVQVQHLRTRAKSGCAKRKQHSTVGYMHHTGLQSSVTADRGKSRESTSVLRLKRRVWRGSRDVRQRGTTCLSGGRFLMKA